MGDIKPNPVKAKINGTYSKRAQKVA